MRRFGSLIVVGGMAAGLLLGGAATAHAQVVTDAFCTARWDANNAESKKEIVAAVQSVLCGSGIEVRIAGPSDTFDGDSPSNIVNRLTAGGNNGVQIEQSIEARRRFWEPIAHAVALVYAGKLSCVDRFYEWFNAILTHRSREQMVPPLTEAR